MTAATCLIVFSDLDGTLLDHATYDWSPARPALARLKAGCHGLVLASSKTAAEIAPLRDAMGFAHCPAIVENGAGVLGPGDDGTGGDAADHAFLLDEVAKLHADLGTRFTGFSDWSVAEVAQRTGLSETEAGMAKARRFSEPGVFSGTPEEEAAFRDALAQAGIAAVRGGRFLTLSLGATKASQMSGIVAGWDAGDRPVRTVAFGDAPNDVAMLQVADLGVIIANPAHAGLDPMPGEADGKIRRSALPGPQGWNAEMLRILDAN